MPCCEYNCYVTLLYLATNFIRDHRGGTALTRGPPWPPIRSATARRCTKNQRAGRVTLM